LTTSFIDHTDFDYETIIDELKKNTWQIKNKMI
jgi:hypothetical protein